MFLEEFISGVEGGAPAVEDEEIVDFIGEDDEFEGDFTGAEELHQPDGLGEFDVAVVVALDEQYRRGPGIDGADGG